MKRKPRLPKHGYADKRFLVPASFGREIRVLVVGCGGSGSEMVDALVRLHASARGIGHAGIQLTLQDGDDVSPANVGRARFLPNDVGANKAALLARRYGLLFGMDIAALTHRCSARGIRAFGSRYDLVITCTDSASFRVGVADHWRRRATDTLWLDLGNGSATGQSVLGSLGLPAWGPRLPNVLDLFPGIRSMPDDNKPSCSMAEALRSQNLFVNRWVVDAAVAMLWRLIAEGFVEHHGALVDMRALKMTPITINANTWSFFGFTEAVAGAPCPDAASPALHRRRAA